MRKYPTFEEQQKILLEPEITEFQQQMQALEKPIIEKMMKKFRDSDGFDHNCVRCDEMADIDCDTKYPGEKGTCCVCAEHNCQEAIQERMIHPQTLAQGSL